MTHRLPFLAALALAAACTGLPLPSSLTPITAEPPLQALVVTTAEWDASRATAQRYERAGPSAPWVAVGQPVPAVTGRRGLAWGEGLHESPAGMGPAKREGDGRAPAGIYRLSGAFGYAPADSVRTRLPYRRSTAQTQCVDDPASRAYNTIQEVGAGVRPDWTSHEEMLRGDSLYRLGVFVDHNVDPAAAGRGSCIFLHVWAGPAVGTAGCTAFAPAALEEIVGWLDPAKRPVLVQLPRAEYARLRDAWALP
jgi:L,D-peptidoglycan transpeptidase YkuD (ErfK/YbiS/YcfS/YnhG family)